MEILIGVSAFVVLLLLFILIGYVKAPPDTAYMISGFRKPRILIGKAGIRIPFLERLDKLSLKMFSVDVKTTDFVPNAEYINVKVDATVKIRIGQSQRFMMDRIQTFPASICWDLMGILSYHPTW